MREAVIVASSRTGLAKSFRGSFNLTRPDDMAAHCVKDLLKKVPQLGPADTEDVVMGPGFPDVPQREGKFKDEIAPMKATMEVTDKATGQKSRKEVVVDRDECNRPDTTLEGLAKLPPAFKEGGTVTAGNSSQFSDGASATLIMSAERAKALGVRPLGLFRGCVFAACEPDEMGIGPVFAVPKLLKHAGLKLQDVDVIELNEAFALQVVYCRDRLGIDPEKLNPNR